MTLVSNTIDFINYVVNQKHRLKVVIAISYKTVAGYLAEVQEHILPSYIPRKYSKKQALKIAPQYNVTNVIYNV